MSKKIDLTLAMDHHRTNQQLGMGLECAWIFWSLWRPALHRSCCLRKQPVGMIAASTFLPTYKNQHNKIWLFYLLLAGKEFLRLWAGRKLFLHFYILRSKITAKICIFQVQ